MQHHAPDTEVTIAAMRAALEIINKITPGCSRERHAALECTLAAAIAGHVHACTLDRLAEAHASILQAIADDQNHAGPPPAQVH